MPPPPPRDFSLSLNGLNALEEPRLQIYQSRRQGDITGVRYHFPSISHGYTLFFSVYPGIYSISLDNTET